MKDSRFRSKVLEKADELARLTDVRKQLEEAIRWKNACYVTDTASRKKLDKVLEAWCREQIDEIDAQLEGFLI